jgi:hypothetical protein
VLEWLSRSICSSNPLLFVLHHTHNRKRKPQFVAEIKADLAALLSTVRVELGGQFACDLKSLCQKFVIRFLKLQNKFWKQTRRRAPPFASMKKREQELNGFVGHEGGHMFRSFVAALFLARVSLFFCFFFFLKFWPKSCPGGFFGVVKHMELHLINFFGCFSCFFHLACASGNTGSAKFNRLLLFFFFAHVRESTFEFCLADRSGKRWLFFAIFF